jgi:formate-dependent nitrite reductase cytochrome c552 subunit
MLVSAGALAADFLGPESCKGCHAEAYAVWSTSKHARSLESLTREQQKDPRCTACHSPNLADQRVAAVSCETCHGGGQYYVPAFVMKDPELARLVGLLDPGERSCRSCHDAGSPSLRPFDFALKLKAMDHWSAARAKRAAAPPLETAPARATR